MTVMKCENWPNKTVIHVVRKLAKYNSHSWGATIGQIRQPFIHGRRLIHAVWQLTKYDSHQVCKSTSPSLTVLTSTFDCFKLASPTNEKHQIGIALNHPKEGGKKNKWCLCASQLSTDSLQPHWSQSYLTVFNPSPTPALALDHQREG